MNDFQYEKGDRVIINCEPPEDTHDMWVEEFNRYIGYGGIITSVYERDDENTDYDLLNVAFEYAGNRYEYLFYGISLKQNVSAVTTGSYVRIIRKHTKEQGDMSWADSMNELIGSYGKVIDVSKRPNDRSYIYKVKTEYNGQKQLFWYYLYSLMECLEEANGDKAAKKWMLSPDGTIVFKVTRVLPDKSLSLIDKVGRTFDSSKLTVIDAPPECKGFEYVKDQPEYFRV